MVTSVPVQAQCAQCAHCHFCFTFLEFFFLFWDLTAHAIKISHDLQQADSNSRLWCVFELAAFRKANPSGKVVLKPLFLETFIFFGILAIYGLVALEEIRFMIRLSSDGGSDGDTSMFGAGGIEALVGGIGLLPTIWIFHKFRRIFREKNQLISNLRNFDLEKVGCRTERDKNFIYSGIRAWYGSTSAFTEHVRGPLAAELTGPFARSDLPFTSWLMLATPFVAATLDFFVNQCQSSISKQGHQGLYLIFLNRTFAALNYFT